MSYSAIIARVKTRPHPNADRLQLGLCLGNQVIIGLNIKNDTLGVFFDAGGQLSKEICIANDLVERRDQNGKRAGGYFPKNRRVRAQNFRGEKSDGYWTILDSLNFTKYDLSKLEEGFEFTELNGIPICNKYETKATKAARNKKNKKPSRSETAMFPMHFDTKQFRREVCKIRSGSLIILTEKVHGTSQRYSHTLDEIEVPFPWWKRIWNKIAKELSLPKFKTKYIEKWVFLSGTRRVILQKSDNLGYYDGDTFRENVIRPIQNQLRKGETIYFEVVGWTTGGKPIMPPGNTKVFSDKQYKKNFIKKYGEIMHFSYKCPPGTCDMYVYRITISTICGHQHDLSWEQVKARCNQLGLKPVPELHKPFIYDGDEEKLRKLVESLTDGTSTIDSNHIREGVCLRAEKGSNIPLIVKSKSWAYGVLEGYVKDKEDYVDIEEVS